MKKFITLLIITVLSTGCATHKNAAATTGTTTGTGIGESFETAVIIKEKSETKGVSAEYKWINKHYPSAKVISQSLSFHDKKPYDIIKIRYKGKTKDVYFDISNFFGKF